MIFPISSLVAEHREIGMVLAVAIGFGFGFVLERAGFGRASKLAAQFYLHDMTVFKVMFGAIVTAMLGMVLFAGLGWLDFGALGIAAAGETFLGPMIVGGLLLGAGFIISGYCPGTSAVGVASGHLDAVFAFVGVIVGSLVYGAIFPFVESFHLSGNLGSLFLYDVLGLPAALLALLVALMAVGCFIGAEKVERIFTKKRTGDAPSVPSRPRRLVFAGLGTAAGLALLTLALPASSKAPTVRQALPISVSELARRVLDQPWTQRIIDTRDQDPCAAQRIPGSECVPEASLGDLGLAYMSGVRDLVLVAESERNETAPEAALVYPGRVYSLDGGFEAWQAYALTAPEPPTAEATTAEQEDFRFRAALHQALTGSTKAPPPPAPVKKYVPRKKAKGGGCS